MAAPETGSAQDPAPIVLRLGPGGGSGDWRYRVAGELICSDSAVPHLDPFRVSTPAVASRYLAPSEARAQPPAPPRELDAMPVRFDEQVWLAHERRHLVVREGVDWTVLVTAGCEPVAIERARGQICRIGAHASQNPRLMHDLVAGPALILALAERGIFCLHASAASVRGVARVFLGRSGVGKSTLVADLSACHASRARRLADDIVPVSCAGGLAWVLPDFPQLKLATTCQQTGEAASPVPLDRVLVLSEEEPTGDEQVASGVLSTTEATLALVRHTVAAKIFSPALLDRHIDACAMLGASVPVSSVAFARDLDRLDKLRQALIG